MGRTSKKKLKKKKKKDKEVAGIFDWGSGLVNWTERMRRRLKGDTGEFDYATVAAKGGPIRMKKGGSVDARKIAKKYFKGTF